jgi:Matrixin
MRSTRLQLEALEERDLPSTFGNAWLDGQHLTLSFASDGTDISGSASELFRTIEVSGTDAQFAILRAFQTWAVNSNLNIGVVADGGQSFYSEGAIQGDARFGDIRVGAAAIPQNLVAITSSFNYFNTLSGNIVINTNMDFAKKYDLFTAMLQEAGHSLGVGNTWTDTTSAMYEYYIGKRTGLSSADIAAIQSLYGLRQADAYEGSYGNNTISGACAYSSGIEADLTTMSDVDYYRFSTSLLSTQATIQLEAAGLSLVTARLSVYDSSGHLISTISAADALHNNLTLQLSNLSRWSTYYVKVEGANGDVFNIGAYRLTITQNDLLNTATGLLSLENGLDNTLASAVNLVAKTTSLNLQTDYFTRASLSTGSDVDYYTVKAPTASSPTVAMVATVWTLGNSNLNPRIEVYNSAGAKVDAQVLTNNNGSFCVQVANAASGQTYYVKVFSDQKQTGDYSLAVDYRPDAIVMPVSATNTVNTSQADTGTLTVTNAQMMHFVLDTNTVAADPNATFVLKITDKKSNTVAELRVNAGDVQSFDLFLAPGTYTVNVSIISNSGATIVNAGYRFSIFGMTDPVAASRSDPNEEPATSSPSSSSSTSSDSNTASTEDEGWYYWWGETPSDSSTTY